MARKPTGNPTGCPQKTIDWDLFEQLCEIQCTQSEMASMLKIHIDTLRDRCEEKYGDSYSNVYKRFSENGKCSLRRFQFVLSKTNTAMAIWLGKQWLGQKDHEQRDESPKAEEMSNKIRLYAALHEVEILKAKLNEHAPKSEPQASKELPGSHSRD